MEQTTKNKRRHTSHIARPHTARTNVRDGRIMRLQLLAERILARHIQQHNHGAVRGHRQRRARRVVLEVLCRRVSSFRSRGGWGGQRQVDTR